MISGERRPEFFLLDDVDSRRAESVRCGGCGGTFLIRADSTCEYCPACGARNEWVISKLVDGRRDRFLISLTRGATDSRTLDGPA